MFDLPEAKRIRRSNLYTRSSTSPSPARSEPDPELQSQLASHFATLYGDFSLSPSKPIPSSESPNRTHPEEAEQEHEEQAYEFRLFSAPLTSISTAGTTTQKIILTNESEDTGTGGFIHARRPKSYYFHTPSSGDLKAQFEAAAISGETVLQWREKRAWGLEVPWRVIALRVTPSKSKSKSKAQAPDDGSMGGLDAVTGIEISGTEERRKKPGKKRRILLREKKRKREAAEEARRKVAEEREEAEREKRTRRNREKKVKRKRKEKAKKIGGGEENGVSVDGSVSDPHGDEVMGGGAVEMFGCDIPRA